MNIVYFFQNLALFLLISGLSSMAGQGESIVENFDGNTDQNNWALIQGRNLSSSIEEGKLVIKSTSKVEGNFILLPMPVQSTADYDISMTITQTKGAKNMAYGLCWAARSDEKDYMGFFLSSNGKYTILSRKRGFFKEVKRWTESNLVNKARRANKIQISKRGEVYTYFLNGQQVFASRAERLTGKQMGVALYGKMILEVDSFSLIIPDSQKKSEPTLRVSKNRN